MENEIANFSNITTALIQGVFICQYSHPNFYNFLQKEHNAKEVGHYLNKMDLSLSKLNQGEAYYCSYQHPQQHSSELKLQFKMIIETLRPLVSFLTLIQQANNEDDVIRAGYILRLTDIQSRIENNQILARKLNKIVEYSLFKSQSSDINGKLKQLFKKLIELEYVVQTNQTKQIYQATAKWSLLQEQIEFINDREKLSLETINDVQPEQEELL
ncbi:MAG: hypothetical protein RL637_1020 [Pseudomonadota bacterium]|jgi:hypothetical protein